jgi:formiminoglutamate deiminase
VAGVLLEEKDGTWESVTTGVPTPPPHAERLRGLTLPGLANTHSHAFHRALRARSQEQAGTFWSWRDLMYKVAAALDPDLYRSLARAVFAEMTLTGYTAVGEFHYLHHGPGGRPYDDPNEMGVALIEAAAAAGIRLTLLDTLYLRGGFDRPLDGPQLRFADRSATAWAERASALAATAERASGAVAGPRGGPGVHVGAAIHSVRAASPEEAAVAALWAAERGVPLHAHVSEQRRENQQCDAARGVTPLVSLDSSGALGPLFTAVHGTHLTPPDIALLGGAGGACCACPTTERDLGDGIGPFESMDAAGIRLALGSDSHAVVDGFEEARALEMHARLSCERRGVLAPGAVMAAATAGGMESLGLGSGILAAGALADLVSVRLDSVRTAGADPVLVASAAFAATAADVDTVVVGGRTVVAGGHHLLVDDVAGELARAVTAVIS